MVHWVFVNLVYLFIYLFIYMAIAYRAKAVITFTCGLFLLIYINPITGPVYSSSNIPWFGVVLIGDLGRFSLHTRKEKVGLSANGDGIQFKNVYQNSPHF